MAAGNDLLLAVGLLVLLVIALEVIFRLPVVASHLPAPSLDSRFDTLDIKLHLLDNASWAKIIWIVCLSVVR